MLALYKLYVFAKVLGEDQLLAFLRFQEDVEDFLRRKVL